MFGDKNDRRSKFGKFRGKKPTKPESELEYKNIEYLQRLIGPTGKILSRRRTGFDGQDQRKLANAIKLARFMGLLPYTGPNPNDPREENVRPYRAPRRDRDRDAEGQGGEGQRTAAAGASADGAKKEET